MRALDNIGVTFVNTVLSRGIYEGNVNLTFGTALFTPEVRKEGDKEQLVIVDDIVVSSRMRMDLRCAQQLYLTLYALLEQVAALPPVGTDQLTPVPEPSTSELN